MELLINSYLPENTPSDFPTGTMTAFYLFFAALYFLPMLYPCRFSVKMKSAIRDKTQHQLEEAFANIKAHYKFIRILVIIFLALNIASIALLLTIGLPFS